MKTEEENLSAQQSLDLITQMIQEAKGKVQQNSFYFLFWGWIVVLANLGMFILTQTGYERPYIVWTITIPAWIYSMYHGFKQGKSQGGTPRHFNQISGALWISFGIVIFTLVAFGYKINFQLNPVILLVSAIPAFSSGVILKFKPLMMGGILFWVCSIISFLVPMEFQSLVGAIAIACGYLIPGYMLKTKNA